MEIKRNKSKLKPLLSLLLAVMLSISALPSSYAATQAEVEAQKRQKEAQLAELNRQIKEYQTEISEKKKESASLSNEIAVYDMQIKSTELKIRATKTNIENTGLQIEETKAQIEAKRKEIEEGKKVLAELIVQINQYDSSSALQIGLGSKNFSDFMDQVQYTESVQGKIYSLLQQIKAIKAKLEQNKIELEDALKKLENLQKELVQTENALSDQKGAKVVLLQQTKGQESRYQKLLAASESQEDQIQKEINDLEAQLRGDTGFKRLKPVHGILAWPMDGILTQGYGNTGFTKLGYNFHNGLDIAAPAGTNIYAAADGTVNATGKGQAAYGNWVTIKHTLASGRQIVTLYAHMRSFVVKVGQKLKQGDLVGYEGNTGNTSRLLYGPDRGYHIHFTVFDAEGFGIQTGKYSNVYGAYELPYGYTYNPMDFL